MRLCAGAGTLLPARVSTQPAQGTPQVTARRSCVRNRNPEKGRAGSFCYQETATWVRESHRSRFPQDIFQLICKGEGQRRGDYQALKLLALFLLRFSGTESNDLAMCTDG